MATANEALDDAELVHGNLPMYLEAVRQEIGDRGASWLRWQGEFRSSERAHVLPSVGSTRMWIKQENQTCEDLLVRWAEPFSTWAHFRAPAAADPRGKDVASWRKRRAGQHPCGPIATTRSGLPPIPARCGCLASAAQNQPHDSICGCSDRRGARRDEGALSALPAFGRGGA
jgi:hypothetical protein